MSLSGYEYLTNALLGEQGAAMPYSPHLILVRIPDVLRPGLLNVVRAAQQLALRNLIKQLGSGSIQAASYCELLRSRIDMVKFKARPLAAPGALAT